MGYLEFITSIRFNINWTMLKYKNEYGISSSEQSMYQHLVDEVSSLAMKLSLDYHLCEELAYVHGFAFLGGGRLGWQVVDEFLSDKAVTLDTEAIKRENLRNKVKRAKEQPEDSFYPLLDKMLDGDTSTPEVALVLHLHRILKALQPLKNGRIKEYYDLSANAIGELCEGYLKNGEFTTIDLTKYYPPDMPELPRKMSEEDREDLYSELNMRYNSFKKEHLNATKAECAKHAIDWMLDTF